MYPIKKPFADFSDETEKNQEHLLECSHKELLQEKLLQFKEKIQKKSTHLEKSSSSSQEEIHPTLGNALDIYENRIKILEERNTSTITSSPSSSSSSSLDTNAPSILNIIQEKINHLNFTFENFGSSSNCMHDHFHYLRDCLTQRRIIEESIQDLEKLSPESVQYLQHLLSDQNSLFESQWKPQLMQFINKTSQKLQEMHIHIQKQADTMQEEFVSQSHSSIHHSFFSDFFSWKILLGIGLGSLTALAFHQWFKEEKVKIGEIFKEEKLTTTPHSHSFSHDENIRIINHLDTIKEYLHSFMVLPPPQLNTYTIENYDELNQLLDICQMIWF